MIKTDDIKIVLETMRSEWPDITAKDIVFAVLCDSFEDKDFAFRVAYEKKGDGKGQCDKKEFKSLLSTLEPFGVGMVSSSAITKEQNKQDLVKLLGRVQSLGNDGELELKDALKLEGDLRVKLNDKFEMEESQKQKRIIVVPSKHDIICPNTNRECNFWPTKSACIKHYNLKEDNNE